MKQDMNYYGYERDMKKETRKVLHSQVLLDS